MLSSAVKMITIGVLLELPMCAVSWFVAMVE